MTTSFLRAAAFALAAAASSLAIGSAHAAADPAAIVKHYTDIAHAKYSDALDAAKALDAAIDALIAKPGDDTLHQFQEAGLLREVAIDASRSYFDTDTSDHHHFYLEDEQRVVDIPASAIVIGNLPPAPTGMVVTHVDVVVRVRKTAGSEG